MTDPTSGDSIHRPAQRLTTARRNVGLIDSLDPFAPIGLASAHRIADAHAELLGWNVVGWKVGCTSERAMEILNCPEPFSGRLFAGTQVVDGQLAHDALIKPLLESEFIFTLGNPLPPRDAPYTVDEVRSATATVTPAFELVAPRYRDWLAVDYFSLIADSGCNGGFVMGNPVAVDECPSLADVAVSLAVDGVEVSRGMGSDILGEPWAALVWLANHLSDRGIGLASGDLVMSGTCTGADPLPEGSTATATFEGLGEVTVRRTNP